MFESIFCYFPITFRPPPNDPYGITSQDLKWRLRECLAASSSLGSLVLPQLFAKLDSGSPNVKVRSFLQLFDTTHLTYSKKDVLETLRTCVESYRIETVSNHAIVLWDSLKYEIFNVQDEDLAEESIKVLQAVSKRCYSQVENGLRGQSPNFLDSVMQDCLERLKEPQLKQAKAAYRILNAIARPSFYALDLIVKAVLPRTIFLYEDADALADELSSLEVMQGILEGATVHFSSPRSKRQENGTLNPVKLFKDKLFSIFGNAFSTNVAGSAAGRAASRVICIDCLTKLCVMQDILEDVEIKSAIDGFENIALAVETGIPPDLRAAAVHGLVQVAKAKVQFIMERTIPSLLSKLSDNTGAITNSVVLNVLGCLGAVRTLTDPLARRLYDHLEEALAQDASLQYCNAIISTLYLLLIQLDSTRTGRLQIYWPRTEKIIRITARHCISNDSRQTVDANYLDSLGSLTGLIVQNASHDLQASVASQIFTLFTENRLFVYATDTESPPFPRRLSVIMTVHILRSLDSVVSRIKIGLACILV